MEFLTPPRPGNERLIERIRERIREAGRITFAEFMEAALYDPDGGYYTSGREIIGTGGDYLTSPAMHPAFGAMIARWLDARRREMGEPDPFDIVEMGAGKGLLCAAILAHASEYLPDLYASARYRIIEQTDLRRTADPRLQGLGIEDQISYAESLDSLPDDSVRGCFISNELVDAFPVHLVRVVDGELREIHVTWRDGGFVEVVGEPSTPEIHAYFDRLGISLPDGYTTEVNLRAFDWMRQVGRKLRSGFVLTIDYGYTAQEYYSPERSRGTLLCYYRHTYCEDPYIRVGEQDITAHVDFTSLIESGREVGLAPVEFTTQREFLIAQGVQSWVAEHTRAPRERRVIASLLDPEGMGGFRVLIQRR